MPWARKERRTDTDFEDTRIGRKPIFRIAYAGVILSFLCTFAVLLRSDIFPVQALLVSPVFTVVGGGLSVTVAVIHSMIADVTTER